MKEIIFQDQKFTIFKEQYIYKNGYVGVLEYVSRPFDGSRVLVINEKEQILLNYEFRPEQDAYDWRLPGGQFNKPDEVPINAAKRELLEETGIDAEDWQFLWSTAPDGNIRLKRHFFLAQKLKQYAQNLDMTEDITPQWFSKKEAMSMALSGEIKEEISALAILKYYIKKDSLC